MSEITLEQLQAAQNEYIAAQTAKINSLETNNAAALAALSELAQRVYGYTHSAMVTDTLDAVYDSVITDNPALAAASAVGFTALLKDGDCIPTQGNILFINGTQEENDYTFSGENSENGTELVNVWFFENQNSLVLSQPPEYSISEAVIKHINAEPTVERGYTDFTYELKTFNFVPSSAPLSTCKMYQDIDYPTEQLNLSPNLVEYTSTAQTLVRKQKGFYNNSNLKLLNFPELVNLGTSPGNDIPAFFDGCSNAELIFNFPKLKYIYGGLRYDRCIFNKCYKVIIPETVERIDKYIIDNASEIELNCKDAEFIDNIWCVTKPTVEFKMCSDWGVSVNIAIAAANWSKADFVDLFENKLRDMGDEVREIKIPSAIYDSLTDEEFAFAEDKGWTVGA